jgi:site-specific DNA-methyltransferase (adenine-specific)
MILRKVTLKMITQLIQGNSLHHLRDMAGQSVDFVFYDPPYNVKKKYDGYSDNLPDVEYRQWMVDVLGESNRISRRGVAVYIAGTLVPLFLSLMPNSHLIIVHKRAAGVCSNNYMLQYHAVIATGRPIVKCKDVWDDIRLPGEGYFFREGRFDNPGLTGLELTKKVLHHFTEVGDTVVDPFVGTGTTAVAGLLMGRNVVGFEQSSKYLNIAAARIENVSLPENQT